jgi:cytochrome c oxidase subunit IV
MPLLPRVVIWLGAALVALSLVLGSLLAAAWERYPVVGAIVLAPFVTFMAVSIICCFRKPPEE